VAAIGQNAELLLKYSASEFIPKIHTFSKQQFGFKT